MPWPTLVVPTAGTVITTAYASAQIVDPLTWLRLMTGNADPPGAGYAIVSSGLATTAWAKISGNELASGAAVANLGYTPVNAAGDVITGGLTVVGNVVGAQFQSSVTTGTAPLAVASATEVSNLNAALLNGMTAAAIIAAGAAAAGGVPSGIVAMVRTAAEIPSGWSRESAMDGRMPVGDGSTFSTTFTQLTNYGSSWSFTPNGSVSGISLGASTANSSANTATGGGTHNDAMDTHSHGVSGGAFSGAGTTWVIPSRAVVFCRKN